MNILHDIHTHNVFSSCCTDPAASTRAYLQKEAELGNRVFGLSNHLWDERVKGASNWYAKQTVARGLEAKNAFSGAPAGLRTLFGAETEYYACRDTLGMSPEGAAQFDYLLIPHSHLHMRNEVMADFPAILEARERVKADMAKAMPYLPEKQLKAMAATLKEADLLAMFPDLEAKIDRVAYIGRALLDSFAGLLQNEAFLQIAGRLPVSIAHSFSPCGVPSAEKNAYLRAISNADITPLYRAAAKLGVYIELNIGAIREVSQNLADNRLIEIYRLAKAAGCRFTFGTDSHTVRGLEAIRFGNEVAAALELTPADIAEFVRDGVEA